MGDWTNDPVNIPKVVDVSKFFNPTSYLTAVKQLACQQQMLELDKLMVFTEVTKRQRAAIDAASREGAYVDGMYLEGARWDQNGNCLEESKPKEMFSKMPVINCKAGMATDSEKGIYVCPTYCTCQRRPNFVFAGQLRTKYPAAKWVGGCGDDFGHRLHLVKPFRPPCMHLVPYSGFLLRPLHSPGSWRGQVSSLHGR